MNNTMTVRAEALKVCKSGAMASCHFRNGGGIVVNLNASLTLRSAIMVHRIEVTFFAEEPSVLLSE